MDTTENQSEPQSSQQFEVSYTLKTRIKHAWFIVSGAMASALWLTLFVAGLMVDSAYYRVAINYGFADIRDWIWAILTFTVSNVAILAFFAGLLGGIISKLRATEGFTINTESLKVCNKDISFQIENPFVSAVRGMFVFVAILFVQYVSSFNDLGSINKDVSPSQAATEINYDQFYSKLKEQISDSSVLIKMDEVWKEQVITINKELTDTALVSRILLLKDSLHYLKDLNRINNYNQKADSSGHEAKYSDRQIQKLKTNIKSYRRKLKPPANVDFSNIGISSFSYFKFAIIVSFLAFIFGYDASGFASFLGKLPIISDSKKKNKNEDENNAGR